MKLHLVNDQARSADRPKLGLGYISSYLKEYCDDIEVSVSFQGDDTIGVIREQNPDIVGLTATTETFNNVINIGREIKDSLNLPLLIGGTHITILPQHLPEWIDAGVIGEGESTMLEIIESYRKNCTLVHEDIKGIIYRDGQRLIKTYERELIDPLDSIPFPDWDMLGLSDTGPGHIITSRGCTYKCVFCASAAIWKKIRFFSPEYVVKEIKTIVEKFGRQEILIYDDLFTADRKRVRRISELICQEGLEKVVKFECLSNVNHFSPETAQDLKNMNVQRISFGMESGSPAMLNYLKKGTVTKEKIHNAVKAGIDNGMQVLGSFMIGIPGETEEDLMMTYNFIKDLRLTETGINVATPFPGTELWNYAVDNGYIKDEWDESIYAMATITPETIKDKRLLCSIDKNRFIEIYKSMIDLDSMLIDRRIRIGGLKDIVLNLSDKGTFSSNSLKVLDVNCEDGTLGAAIKAKDDVEVVGLNPEMEYITDSERRLDKVIRGGIEELRSEYEDGYFDLIIFNEMPPDNSMNQYHEFLKPNGLMSGTFANRMHFSYLAYSLFGIDRPFFETTNGTFQYMNWGIPDKERFPGTTMKDMKLLFQEEGCNLSSIYEFKGLDSIFVKELSNYLGSYLWNPDEFNNESKVIRYFFTAQKNMVAADINNDEKNLEVNQETGMERNNEKGDHQLKFENLACLTPDDARRILHLGSGSGEFGKILLENGAEEVVGVDRDKEACEKAGENLSAVIFGNIEEIHLPYDNGYFDCIIINSTLEYLRDPLSVLQKLKACLSDTGTVVAVIPNTGNIFQMSGMINGQWTSDEITNNHDAPLRFFTRKEIERLIADAGFELNGLSVGSMHPDYHKLDLTVSQDISVGRITLKNMNPEETKDMFAVDYLIRAEKRGSEFKQLHTLVEVYKGQGKMADAKQAIEEYLEMHLADINALLLHAEVCFNLGLYEQALGSLNKICLFEPEREDAVTLKKKIERIQTADCTH